MSMSEPFEILNTQNIENMQHAQGFWNITHTPNFGNSTNSNPPILNPTNSNPTNSNPPILNPTNSNPPDYSAVHKCSLAPGFKSKSTQLEIQRHPETGVPIKNISGSYYSLINKPNQNDASNISFSEYLKEKESHKESLQKTKIDVLNILYDELDEIRSQINKLNKSVDNIYKIIRDIN
jgi:hypothetical protein